MAEIIARSVLLLIGSMLGSCGTSDKVLYDAISVRPVIELRNCAQLTDAIKATIKRQQDLQELERRAGSGIGSAIAATTYHPEYLKEHANEINMRRSAREKGCKLPTDFPPLERS